MSILKLPKWVQKHVYQYRPYHTLEKHERNKLRDSLKHFNPKIPDVSVVIPAWNEESNIFRTLSSLAYTTTNLSVEIIVIDNNCTDRTPEILRDLGVLHYLATEQGIAHARQKGLEMARGKYHLCADCDTLYPPDWIDHMVNPMRQSKDVVGVYGRYSFIPPEGRSRLFYRLYEGITGILVRKRRKHAEFMNVLGFNMGFVTSVARETAGFSVDRSRKFSNSRNSQSYIQESEDGRIAVRLLQKGTLKLVTDDTARVYTSPRRLEDEGGLAKAFSKRIRLHLR